MPKAPDKLDDMAAFYEAVAGTKPLSQKKVRLRPPLAPKVTPRNFQESEPLLFHENLDIAPVQGEEFISYKQESVSNKILRKLRKGQYNVEAILDLHGMSVEKARVAADHFLQDCLHEGIRVVLVIHGKGHHSHGPILKNKLNNWLRKIDVILAFCSASPTHGSRGAMYILLKSIKEEHDT